MKIIVVNGPPRSGKDLFCQFAVFYRNQIYNFSTIDEVKKLAKILGWDGIKDAKGRKFLSDLKDAMSEYNDLPREYVLKQIEKECNLLNLQYPMGAHRAIFFVQAREPEEIDRWVTVNGAKSLFITRPNIEQKWGNHADDEVFDYDYDYLLINNGTKAEWAEKTREFIDKIREERWQSHL